MEYADLSFWNFQFLVQHLPLMAVSTFLMILYLLHRAYNHLDKGSGAMGIKLFEFSSLPFNTLQFLILRDLLLLMRVDPSLDNRHHHWRTSDWLTVHLKLWTAVPMRHRSP